MAGEACVTGGVKIQKIKMLAMALRSQKEPKVKDDPVCGLCF